MDTFDKLTDLFRQFPGIGPRQAKRFVYFLLSRDKDFLEALSTLVAALRGHIVQCGECFRFFQKKDSMILCPICADQHRSRKECMVVARDTDLEAMEKSGIYQGKYFVLGGTIPLIERKTADKLRLKELLTSVGKNTKAGTLKEVILALSANPDGEHTSEELKRMLSAFPIKISTLGRGLSTGSELEYADKETLKSAFKNRSVNS